MTACASSFKDKVTPIGSTGVDIPPLSTDLEQTCAEPTKKVGQNVYSAWARARAAYWCERAKHLDTVNAYHRVRKARPKG